MGEHKNSGDVIIQNKQKQVEESADCTHSFNDSADGVEMELCFLGIS